MRRTTVNVEKKVEGSEIGLWQSPTIGFATPFGLSAFVKSREDMETVLRRFDLLTPGQVVELSGFSLHGSLRHAMNLQLEVEAGGHIVPYRDLVARQHIQVSWPPDLLWLCHEKPIKTFRDFVADSLPLSEMAISPHDCERIADKLASVATGSEQGYRFWRRITKEQVGSAGTLSRLLLEASISAANRARAHSMAGIVPCVDLKTPSSLRHLDSYNMAYGHVLDDRVNDGLRTPAYLYTVALNSTVFQEDEWPRLLEDLVRRAEKALESGLFEGVHLTIRGLGRISLSPGRIAVASKLIARLLGACNRNQLPLVWSRSAFAGLAGRDAGVDFASYSLNLSTTDLYPASSGVTDPTRLYGRVANPIRRVTWSVGQVRAAMQGPDHGMPDLGSGAPIAPGELQLARPDRYRVEFAKPYNVASFRYLDAVWKGHVNEDDSHPGREYLQGFESPYNQWGLR